MKTDADTRGPPLKKFPTYKVGIYLGTHIFVGLLVSVSPLALVPQLPEFLALLDDKFPAFSTMFVQSKEPAASKLMLLLWWMVFLPWGLIWWGLFTNGFKAENPKAIATVWSKTKWIAIGLFFAAMLSYGHSYKDHAANLMSAASSHTRTSRAALFFNNGAGWFSAWLAGMSLLFVISSVAVLTIVRDTYEKLRSLKHR